MYVIRVQHLYSVCWMLIMSFWPPIDRTNEFIETRNRIWTNERSYYFLTFIFGCELVAVSLPLSPNWSRIEIYTPWNGHEWNGQLNLNEIHQSTASHRDPSNKLQIIIGTAEISNGKETPQSHSINFQSWVLHFVVFLVFVDVDGWLHQFCFMDASDATPYVAPIKIIR